MNRSRLIIDGYNLLHAHPRYAIGEHDDLDSARARLVADVAGHAEGGPRTVLVFDGAGNPASDGSPHHIGALTVIFSPRGVSADAVIESLARRFRDRGEEVLVITSDIATRETVRSGSVAVLSSKAFAEDLLAEDRDRQPAARSGRRMPVSQRIDPDVAAKLDRWARGEGSPRHKD